VNVTTKNRWAKITGAPKGGRTVYSKANKGAQGKKDKTNALLDSTGKEREQICRGAWGKRACERGRETNKEKKEEIAEIGPNRIKRNSTIDKIHQRVSKKRRCRGKKTQVKGLKHRDGWMSERHRRSTRACTAYPLQNYINEKKRVTK